MNPTQNSDNTAPEPVLPGLLATGSRFFDLLDKVPGGAGIRATLLAGLDRESDDESATYELTETGRAALDTVDSDEEPVAFVAVRGWCEICGRALPWKCAWDEPLCSDCVMVVLAANTPGALVTSADSGTNDGRCQRCGTSGGYPYCERSYNGRWSCADLAGMDASDVDGSEFRGLDEPRSTCPVDLVTETDDGTTARVLRSAALYLERHGWIQGAYYDATTGLFTPPACLVGAIGMVCYGGPVDAPAQHFDNPGFLNFETAVLHLDRYLLVENGSESYEFNDARGRRLEDVTRVLRDAAARPAEELIDALRVIDARNADNAALAQRVTPSGVFADTEPVIEVDLDEFVDFVCHGQVPASFTKQLDTGVDIDGGDA